MTSLLGIIGLIAASSSSEPVEARPPQPGPRPHSTPCTSTPSRPQADQRCEAVALADQLGVGLLRFHDQP